MFTKRASDGTSDKRGIWGWRGVRTWMRQLQNPRAYAATKQRTKWMYGYCEGGPGGLELGDQGLAVGSAVETCRRKTISNFHGVAIECGKAKGRAKNGRIQA